MILSAWALALSLAAAIQAQASPQAQCPAQPGPLPRELAGWSAMTPLAAGATTPVALPIGRSAKATLFPTGAIVFAVPPAKPGAADGFGGFFAITVPRAGRYRVALGGGAWVDLIGGGHALASVAHDHGPACSPVRKTVDFDLAPGRYLLQLSGTKTATLPLMVVALPR